MKNLCYFFFLSLVIFACQTTKQESTVNNAPPALKLKWSSDTLLTTCESVIFDEANNVLYVANINGDPSGKDGNGFISKVDLDGKITNLKWVTGMDAPKGMGIVNDKLYVSDIDRVHEISISAGTISNTYKAEGAEFLNDVATDANGKVYISDSGTGQVLTLDNGTLSFWTQQPNPNGLLVEGGNLLIALWDAKSLNTIDIETKTLTQKTDSIDNPDGIEAVGDGGYFVSSWNGMVHYVSPDWKRTLILDTRKDSVSAADIEYIPTKRLLLVPTFFKNRVDAYEVVRD